MTRGWKRHSSKYFSYKY